MLQRFKSLRQAAALPYILGPGGVEVALITSRETKRWIIPKGWPADRMTLAATAALEALEEAGIEGDLAAEPVGSFIYEKRLAKGYSVPCRTFVFPLLARQQQLDWKEKKRRRIAWLPLKEAAKLADDKGLSVLLKQLSRNPAGLANQAAIQDIAFPR